MVTWSEEIQNFAFAKYESDLRGMLQTSAKSQARSQLVEINPRNIVSIPVQYYLQFIMNSDRHVKL